MEQMIAKLVDAFAAGKLNRRQLIQNLAITASAGAAASAVPALGAEASLKAIGISHVSYSVKDYKRTRDFYSNLLGLKVSNDDGKSRCNLAIGNINLIARNGKEPTAWVDHLSYYIDNWNKGAIEANLKARGLNPQPEGADGLQFKDPDGMHVQLQAPPKK
jgi:catechol 2,3-dioxygenase-like lactoylglutathione lyase family enzyme